MLQPLMWFWLRIVVTKKETCTELKYETICVISLTPKPFHQTQSAFVFYKQRRLWNTTQKRINKPGCEYNTANSKDTVKIIVFDPHKTDSAVSQDWRERPLLLFVHQKGHEVLNLGHVHISPIISAHQDLKGAAFH